MTRVWILTLMTFLARPLLAVTSMTPLGSNSGAGETILLGPRSVPGPADRKGPWQIAPGHLALPHVDDTHEHWFVPQAPDMTDGFVRLRLETPRAGKVALGLRIAVDAKDVALLSGYAIVLGKADVTLSRWDHGRLRPLDRPVPLPGLAASKTVEIEAWLVGPHLGAQILDGETLKPLGSASLSDTTYVHGRTGVWVLARKGAGPTLLDWRVHVAVQQTGQGVRMPAGSLRFVKGTPGAPPPGPIVAPGITALDPTALERARRSGLDLATLDVDSPFRWLLNLRSPMDRAVYRDGAAVAQDLTDLQKRFPTLCRVVELGRSAQGRPLLALEISDHPGVDEPEPSVLLNGAHHGDELVSVEFALDAAHRLLEGAAPTEGAAPDPQLREIVQGLHVWVVPLVNPDGVQRYLDESSYAGRKNARDTLGDGPQPDDGVDLNRNYPFRWFGLGELGSRSRPQDDWYRGPQPASEAETQAMMKLADSEHFATALSYHTLGTVILAPYTTDGAADPEPNDAWNLAKRLVKALPVQPNGRRFVLRRNIYPVDGVDQDWLRAAHGTDALLLEGAVQNPLSARLLARTVAATRDSWRTLLEATLRGPRVSGRVVDARGQPVAAEVVVREQAPRMGERWTSRCRDGHFDRMLAKPGRATLRVTVPGHAPLDLPLDVTGVAIQDVQLPFAGHDLATPGQHACAVPELCSQAALQAQRAGTCLPRP